MDNRDSHMRVKAKLLSISTAAMILMLSTANAWDGTVQGVIQQIDFVGGASGTPNFDVRVSLVGGLTICTGGTGNWGYVNTTDPNYSTIVAALMMAKTSGSKVTLFTLKDPGAGYCHVGYVSIT